MALNCIHEVSNLYVLLFTVDSGFVLVVLTVMAVLLLHGYRGMLI